MKNETKMRAFIVILGVICCSLPVILLSIGVGSISIGALIENYGSYFLIAGIIVLVFAGYLYFRKSRIEN